MTQSDLYTYHYAHAALYSDLYPLCDQYTYSDPHSFCN